MNYNGITVKVANAAERKGDMKMKSATYIQKIEKEQACSIATVEKLTAALHREELLDKELVIRFRPLFGDFDVVNAGWFETQKMSFHQPIGSIKELANLVKMLEYAKKLAPKYRNAE